jgi:hypothetical protein
MELALSGHWFKKSNSGAARNWRLFVTVPFQKIRGEVSCKDVNADILRYTLLAAFTSKAKILKIPNGDLGTAVQS